MLCLMNSSCATFYSKHFFFRKYISQFHGIMSLIIPHAAFYSVCLRNGAASRFRNEHNLAVNQVVSVGAMGSRWPRK